MTTAHEYTADLLWERAAGERFTDHRYHRRHRIRFDGGVEMPGSSAPSSVPLPWSDPEAVDPEEAFVASIASCHMLWFLALAAKAGFVVQRYGDQPRGVMTPNAQGKLWMSTVTLHHEVAFEGERQPTPEEHRALHHHAHEECYIANSVRSEIRVVLA